MGEWADAWMDVVGWLVRYDGCCSLDLRVQFGRWKRRISFFFKMGCGILRFIIIALGRIHSLRHGIDIDCS